MNCTPTKLLVLEAALAPAGAAVVRDGGVAAVRCAPPGARAGVDLLALARTALADAGLAPADLDGVVTGRGPGSFSGLRVALGLARGIALAAPGVRLGGADSLQILVESARGDSAGAAAPLERPAVALPWGRLRVLVGFPGAGGGEPGAALVQRASLAAFPGLAGRTVIVHPDLAAEPLPPGAVRRLAEDPPVAALARLAARGALALVEGAPVEPSYAVPPDAVLPGRAHTLPPGYAPLELSPDHVSELERLLASGFDSPWSAALLEDELRRGAFTPGVRGPAGELAAAAVGRLEPDALSVFIVVVDPAHRGRGLGRGLVRDLLARGRAAGAARADLEVRAGNAPALALYASEGFVPVGLRRRYYRDGSDALLMSATLAR